MEKDRWWLVTWDPWSVVPPCGRARVPRGVLLRMNATAMVLHVDAAARTVDEHLDEIHSPAAERDPRCEPARGALHSQSIAVSEAIPRTPAPTRDGAPGLDLDHHEDVAVAGHDVGFTARRGEASAEHAPTAPREVPDGERLSRSTEDVAASGEPEERRARPVAGGESLQPVAQWRHAARPRESARATGPPWRAPLPPRSRPRSLARRPGRPSG